MQSRLSRLLLIFSLMVLAGVVVMFIGRHFPQPDWESAPDELKALLWPAPREPAPFRMLDQNSKPFSQADFKGRWSLVFFGYLQCPDVCPTTLQALAGMRRLMGESGDESRLPNFVFVSIDPGHDTPARMDAWLDFFDASFVGLSGPGDQLDALARSLGIIYAENIDANGTRSMDHSTSVIVIDPAGRAVAALPAPHQPSVMLRQFNALRGYLGN